MSDIISQIGKIIPEKENIERDAIHIAIVQVTTLGYLKPGQPVKFVFGTKDTVIACRTKSWEHKLIDTPIGIIDPYLTHPISSGSKVLMFLYPGSTNGMRHHFHSPVLDFEQTELTDSQKWMINFCKEWGFDYDNILDLAKELKKEEIDPCLYLYADGVDLHSHKELGDDYELFWKHLENISGTNIPKENRECLNWSCSC